MAVVGMAFLSALLGVVFDKMASPGVVGFLSRRKQTEELLVKKLEIALLPMNVVLEDAEEKQVTNPNVRRWIDELKDFAYNAEDMIDEIATKALRHKLDSEFQPDARKVRNSITTFLNSFVHQRLDTKIKECLLDYKI